MALLSEKERKEYFSSLGYNYDENGIKAIQKKYLRPKDVDGIYGPDTDNLVRHLVYVKIFCKNFQPEEFKCECGGRFCTGYPTYMKPNELMHIQAIRDHYGKPITITCGLRCKPYNNSLKGSIPNSKHLSGRAVDFYQAGVTDTLSNRKSSIKYIKTLPNHNYTYGNGINSAGYGVSAPYMGNALHTDTNGDGSEKIVLKSEVQPVPTTTLMTNADILTYFAKEFAYKKDTKKANVNGGAPTALYKTALDTVFPPKTRRNWSAGPRKGASCDVFVSTVLRFSGIDKKCPRGVDAAYLSKTTSKYKKVSVTAKTIKDGDIICCSNGHICIHVGGKIKEAASGGKALNYQGRFYPKTTNTLATRLKGATVFRVK